MSTYKGMSGPGVLWAIWPIVVYAGIRTSAGSVAIAATYVIVGAAFVLFLLGWQRQANLSQQWWREVNAGERPTWDYDKNVFAHAWDAIRRRPFDTVRNPQA